MSDVSTTASRSRRLGQPTAYWLWRAWQALIVPLFYPLFGIACALLLALVPIAHVSIRHPQRRTRWFRYALHHCARTWFGIARYLQVFDYQLSSGSTQALAPLATEQIPLDSDCGYLVIANHPSLIDVLMVLALMPNLCCVLKSDLRQHPILGLLIRNLNYLSNDDPERWLEQAQERLSGGESLLVFAEGTRTKPGQPIRFKLGATELALRSSVPIVPLVMAYNSDYLSKSCPWYRLPQTKLTYRLSVGPVVRPEPVPANKRTARRWLNQHLQDYFQAQIQHTGRHPDTESNVSSIRALLHQVGH